MGFWHVIHAVKAGNPYHAANGQFSSAGDSVEGTGTGGQKHYFAKTQVPQYKQTAAMSGQWELTHAFAPGATALVTKYNSGTVTVKHPGLGSEKQFKGPDAEAKAVAAVVAGHEAYVKDKGGAPPVATPSTTQAPTPAPSKPALKPEHALAGAMAAQFGVSDQTHSDNTQTWGGKTWNYTSVDVKPSDGAYVFDQLSKQGWTKNLTGDLMTSPDGTQTVKSLAGGYALGYGVQGKTPSPSAPAPTPTETGLSDPFAFQDVSDTASKAAVYSYTGEGHGQINKELRTYNVATGSIQGKVAGIDKAMSTSTVAETQSLWRGCSTAWLQSRAPDLVAGHMFLDPGFLSTSKSKSTARGFMSGDDGGWLLKVDVPAGTHGIDVQTQVAGGGSNPSEKELLVDRDAVLMVNSIDKNKRTAHVTVVASRQAMLSKLPKAIKAEDGTVDQAKLWDLVQAAKAKRAAEMAAGKVFEESPNKFVSGEDAVLWLD